jgi:hypothetical protein
MVARRIYWAILLLSIIVGVYFYGIAPDKYSSDFLVIFALVPFLMFAGAVHGLITHLLKPSVKGKGESLFYPLIMGIVFVILFFIHLFVILPLVCPDFLSSFR